MKHNVLILIAGVTLMTLAASAGTPNRTIGLAPPVVPSLHGRP